MAQKPTNSCFANSNACKGVITKEHVVSKAILEHFGPLDFSVNGKNIKLGKGTYVIRNLCEFHNRMLSEYDNEALKLFTGWHRFLKNTDTTDPTTRCNTINIDIQKIEKWYAKTFINSILFRHRALKPKLPLMAFPIESFRNKIFGGESFEPPFGIYMIDPMQPLSQKRKAWQMSPQFQSVWLRNKETGNVKNMESPTLYYTCLAGIELVGFFNFTGLNDQQALDSLLKDWKEKLVNTGSYREHINFSTTHATDIEYDGRNPTRFINFIR